MPDYSPQRTPATSPRAPHPLLVRLGGLNRTAVVLGAVALLMTGLFLPEPFGGLLLLALAGSMAFVLVTTWPVQNTGTRGLRVTMLSLLVIVALLRTF